MAYVTTETRDMKCTNKVCDHEETHETWHAPLNPGTFQIDHKAKVLCPKCGFKCLAEKPIEISDEDLKELSKYPLFGLGDK